MRKLGIFIFFDKSGIVDDYVTILIDSMSKVTEELIIVINGFINNYGLKKFRQFTERIYIRENIGYDGGAYKDVFQKYLEKDELQNWDEIILFNDTFYGPFFSWARIFDRMESEPVDFWGLSRFLQAKYVDGQEFAEHVQGYFLVVRKRMFMSSSWEKFWNKLDYPQTFQEAVKNFEVNFTVFFSEQGFRYTSWIDLKGFNKYLVSGENVYWCHPYELIKHFEFLIIKRKVISITNFCQTNLALQYIENNYSFNLQNIYKNLERLDKDNGLKPFSPIKLEQFYNCHKKIYVYGYGKFGKEIEQYFLYRKWNIEKFVVSDIESENENIVCYDKLNLENDAGLILALGKNNLAEVYPKVNGKFELSQLLLPQYD